MDRVDEQRVRRVVAELLALLPARPFAVRLPDGTVMKSSPDGSSPSFTLALNRSEALRRMLLPPSELALGEAYLFGDFDIEGDIAAAFGLIDEVAGLRLSWRQVLKLVWELLRLERDERKHPAAVRSQGLSAYRPHGKLHSPQRDQQAVEFHYDLSNDFYKLWLDRRMVYSCAYFASGHETLDEAQRLKLDLLCRKLALQPGERLLDVGCGWGALVMHATKHYQVEATGITLSRAQADEGRARIAAAGLRMACNLHVCHYNDLGQEAQFHQIVSIGMFEHVGEERLPDYFAQMYRVLQPGGLFLLQGGIAPLDRRHAGRGWLNRLGRGRTAFMQKYSFPDSNLISVSDVLALAQQAGFEPLEMACMRQHAVQTVRHWLARIEENRDAAIAEVGEPAYRCWRLVWAGYLHLLAAGRLSEYQFLLAKR